MPIQITSTTDSEKVVTAAMGAATKNESKVEETKSASAEKADETIEESETSKELESKESEESESEESSEEKESKDDDESLDGEQKPKKNGVQKRIDKLVKKNSEKDREIEYLRKELMKKGSEQPQEKGAEKPEVKEAKEGKPSADDFENHADYLEALTDWKLEQKEKAKEAAKKADDLKSNYQKAIEKHNERVGEFKKAQADYEEVISDFIEEHGDLKFSIALEDSILASDVGPQLVYHLAKNKEELDRINALSPLAAAREIGKIEARLSKKSQPLAEKKHSKAPRPIEPVNTGRGSSIRKSIYDESLSQSEYEQLRKEQMAKRA
jgi:uncharacterized protein YozE (UPF0346 family)